MRFPNTKRFAKTAGSWILKLTVAVMAIVCVSPKAHAIDNVVIVIDDSGSMAERLRSDPGITKMDAAKRALRSTLEELPSDTHVGVLALNGGRTSRDHWIIPLGPADVSAIGGAIASLRADGSTPLGAAMKTATDALLSVRAKQYYGRYRLLIVSDGEASDARKLSSHLPDIMGRGITVDVIGVDMAQRHSLATQVHSYRAADDPNALSKAIKTILAESGADAGDAGESDFELLEGFPDEVASAALTALSESGNHPIGTKPAPSREPTGNSNATTPSDQTSNAGNQQTGQGSNGIPGRPVQGRDGNSHPVSVTPDMPIFSSLCCCFSVSFLIVFIGIILVIRTASRRKRDHRLR